MPRVQKVLARGAVTETGGPNDGPSGNARPGEIADTLLLKFDDRRRQQGFVFGGKGTCIEFDFAEPPRLRTDDLLVLDDGRLAEVVADIEPVIELHAKELAKDLAVIARILLALGNRHIPVQILANRIRLQRRPEIEALLAEHGLKGAELTAPFEPDEGAGAGLTAHHHDHGHGHHHDDGHGRHHHGESHGHHHHDGHAGHHHDK
jgi:urease accessory protein